MERERDGVTVVETGNLNGGDARRGVSNDEDGKERGETSVPTQPTR